jgi:hypothetical protein
MGSGRGFPVVAATTAVVWLLLTSVSWAESTEPAVPSGSPDSDQSHVVCTIADPRITEASGLAATADRLYVVNDGGDQVTVFELDRTCRVRDVLDAATDPFDVEDLARAADGTFWLADIGDNRQTRDTVAIETLTRSGSLTRYRFSYPDGPHDAEALLLDHTGRPYLVTKNVLGASGVYTPVRTPSARTATPLRRVTTLHLGLTGTPGGPVGTASQLLVTGGAVSPDGTRVALRTYTDVYLWAAPDGDIGAALDSGSPTRLALPGEQQGESVTFSPDGGSLLTTSEGVSAPVHLVSLPAALGPATTTSTPSRSAATRPEAPETDRTGSRSVLANLVLAAVIATVITFGLGRLRRK